MRLIDEIIGIDTRSINKREYLRTVVRYLETKPSEQYVMYELGKAERRLSLIMDAMPAWYKMPGKEKESKSIEEVYNVSGLRLQIRTLKLILQK